jgi:hypothetical protein
MPGLHKRLIVAAVVKADGGASVNTATLSQNQALGVPRRRSNDVVCDGDGSSDTLSGSEKRECDPFHATARDGGPRASAGLQLHGYLVRELVVTSEHAPFRQKSLATKHLMGHAASATAKITKPNAAKPKTAPLNTAVASRTADDREAASISLERRRVCANRTDPIVVGAQVKPHRRKRVRDNS